MTPAVLALIEALISAAPAAIQTWQTLKPILSEGRDPTPDEWATFNTLRDASHNVVQAEG